jgi:hypothetical protein
MRGCGQHPASPSARFNRSLKIRYQSGVILENQDCVLPAFQNPLHGNDMLQRAGADRSLALFKHRWVIRHSEENMLRSKPSGNLSARLSTTLRR